MRTKFAGKLEEKYLKFTDKFEFSQRDLATLKGLHGVFPSHGKKVSQHGTSVEFQMHNICMVEAKLWRNRETGSTLCTISSNVAIQKLLIEKEV